MGIVDFQSSPTDSGKTARFYVIRRTDGYWWNQSLNANVGDWEAYNASHYVANSYLQAMAETGASAYFSGTFPAHIVAGTVVNVVARFDTVVNTPALTDRVAATDTYYWDGINLIIYSAANVVQVNSNSDAAAALALTAQNIIFDGETSGGSTTTEIWLSDAYDTTKAASYIGNYLVIPGMGMILPARISAYTNQGGGASSVTVEAGKFSVAPDPGTAVQIIRAGAGDLLAFAVPGGYASGTAGYELGRLATIAGSTALITSGAVYVVSPYANGNLVVYQGDAWDRSEGTSVLVTKPSGATWPTDLTGYTITARINKSANNPSAGSDSFDFTATAVTLTGAAQSFRLECGTATANLALGEGTRGYNWQVFATKGSVVQTLVAGTCSVKQKLS